jgi:uncharacterized protein (TIGR02678 family)
MSSEPSAIHDAIERQTIEERQRALRALLKTPLLGASGEGADVFPLVRRHASFLRDWFAEHAGWRLQVEPGLARLRKQPANLEDTTRAASAEGSASAPFSRRRYALLCLALAALERAESQITLGRLAERVLSLAVDPALLAAGFTFKLDTRDDRAELAAVVRLLLALRVLVKVAGDELTFVHAHPGGDALYDVERRALSSLLVARRGPSLVTERDHAERLRALTEEVAPAGEDGRYRAVRHALMRRLLDDPIVYTDDLSAAERGYLTSQRSLLLRRVGEATGFVPEVRAEGVALLDPSGEATDLRMPEEGTYGHATLLLAGHLANALRTRGASPVTTGELHQQMAGWAREHGAYWRKSAREPGAEVSLCRMAIARLEGLGLVRCTQAGVVPRPALARFAYQPAVVLMPLSFSQ